MKYLDQNMRRTRVNYVVSFTKMEFRAPGQGVNCEPRHTLMRSQAGLT